MEKALVVYIPTYHRAEALNNCLHSIILECKRCNYFDLKIYVSNNDNSDIKIKKLVTEMRKMYAIDLIYEENKHNIGADGNMRKAFEIKQNGYCLMLGDDDELKRGAFDILFDVMKKDIAFAILNYVTICSDYYVCNNYGETVRKLR